MVRRLEYHRSSSEKIGHYSRKEAEISGDEKKRKALDGFTHHKLLDQYKKGGSRRTRSQSPRSPQQRPPRARSSGRIPREGSRERTPKRSKDRTSVTGASHRNEITASQTPVDFTTSKTTARSSSRRESRVDRLVGRSHVDGVQSTDRSDVLYQVIRNRRVAHDAMSAGGSKATSKATRLPKNVHRITVSRINSKVSTKTSNTKQSHETEVSNRKNNTSTTSGEVGSLSRLDPTESENAVLRTKELQVQTDLIDDIIGHCVSPSTLLDPHQGLIDHENPKSAVSLNGRESGDKSKALKDSQPEYVWQDHSSVFSGVEQEAVANTTVSTDTNQHQSLTESLPSATVTAPTQTTKRKLDRLLFFRKRSASSRREKVSEASPIGSDGTLVNDPDPVLEENIKEATICAAADTPSPIESAKSARSRSWRKISKSLRRKSVDRLESSLVQPIEVQNVIEDLISPSNIVTRKDVREPLANVGTPTEQSNEKKPKVRRPRLRTPRNKKTLPVKSEPRGLKLPTPKPHKGSKLVKDVVRSSRFSLSPRRSVVRRCERGQDENTAEVQESLPSITIDNGTEGAVEAVLGASSPVVTDTLASSPPRPLGQQGATANGKVDDRLDVEDHRVKQNDSDAREGTFEEHLDCGETRRHSEPRGEKLLHELYGGDSQSYNGKPLTRFIRSSTFSRNERAEDVDSDMSRGRRKVNRSFSFSEDEGEYDSQDDDFSEASSSSEECSSEESAEDEQSERSDPYESDQSSCSDDIRNHSSGDSTLSALSIIKNLKLSRRGNTVTSDISENSAASEWSDIESYVVMESEEEESLPEKDVVQRLLLSKYRKH